MTSSRSPFLASALCSLALLSLTTNDLAAQTAWGARPGLAVSPPARSHSVFVYDPVRKVCVLFGGHIGSNSGLNDTWEWNGNVWRQASPALAPSIRWQASAVWDPLSNSVLLYGGADAGGRKSDTWSWNGTAWTQLSPLRVPRRRMSAGLAYDPVGSQVILFGGWDGGFLGDTWAWNGADWRQLSPAASPSPRNDVGMTADMDRNQILLSGGNNGGRLSETWAWDGQTWSKLPNANFDQRTEHAMFYDPIRRRVVTFAGQRGGDLNDTLEWDGATWLRRWPGVNPSPRRAAAMTWDGAEGRMVMFGGWDNAAQRPLGDTWEYFHLSPASGVQFGTGCSGTAGTPVLSPIADPLPWIGEGWRFEVLSMPVSPNALAWGIIGESKSSWMGAPLPIDLGIIGMPGCPMLTDGNFGLSTLGASQGKAKWTIAVPLDLRMIGTELFLQAIVLDPGSNALGLTVSNGFAGSIGMK